MPLPIYGAGLRTGQLPGHGQLSTRSQTTRIEQPTGLFLLT